MFLPTGVPDGAEAQLPDAGMIDRRGFRFGAGVSATILAVGWLLQAPVFVLVAFLSIAVSAAFGMTYSPYGAAWRRIVKAADLGKPDLEHEYPPRFSQVLGTTFLGTSLLAFALGLPTLGWLVAAAVFTLQVLLATTGYCVGCRLYFLRWWVPSLVTRAFTGGRSGLDFTPEPIRYE